MKGSHHPMATSMGAYFRPNARASLPEPPAIYAAAHAHLLEVYPTREEPHLSAEIAEVLGVLADLHLLDDLTQASTIAGTILADDPNLLGALGLRSRPTENRVRMTIRAMQICFTLPCIDCTVSRQMARPLLSPLEAAYRDIAPFRITPTKRESERRCAENMYATAGLPAVREGKGEGEGWDRCRMGLWRAATVARHTGCHQCRLKSLAGSMHASSLATAASSNASKVPQLPEAPSVHVWWASTSDVGGCLGTGMGFYVPMSAVCTNSAPFPFNGQYRYR